MADELKADLEIGGVDEALADLKAKLSAGFGDVKIGDGFTKEITDSMDGAQKKALSLQGSLKSLAALDPKGKGLDWISKQAQASQKEIAQINKQLLLIQKLASQTSSQSLLDIYAHDAEELSKQLSLAEKKMLRLQQARLNRPAPVGSGGDAGSGIGAALAEYAAPAAAGALLLKTGKDLVDANKKSEGSTLALASAAKQASLSYDTLNQKNAEFARLTGQGTEASKEAFASLVDFSKQAGRTDQIDKLSTGLANLFAAKGIENDKLSDLLSQLKTGQDEVFDRLAGANPSKFYDEFAVSIGTTAEKLTDAQKAQVRFDTVVKLSTIFDGTAEKRLKSMTGQLDSLAAGFENLYTRGGKAASPFVKQQLENILNLGDFFQGKGLFASDESKAKLREQIQKDTDQRLKLVVDGFREMEQKIDEAAKKPNASVSNFRLSFLDKTKYTLASAAKEIEEIKADGTKLIRYENQGEINTRLQSLVDDAGKQADTVIAGYRKSFENVLADKNISVGLLQMAQREFETVQNILPEDVKEKLRKDFAESISSGVARGFEKTLSDVDLNADKLVAGLRKLQAGVAGLLPETTDKLINDYEKALKSMSQTAISLRDTVKDTMVSGFQGNNPLLKLMVDLESATERAEQRFGKYGAAFVRMMAEMDKAAINSQINKILFEGSKKALDFEQQARRLQQTPATQLDQFDRRISFLGDSADYAQKAVANRRAAEDAEFYARLYNPNNPQTALQNRFGRNSTAFGGESSQILEEIKAIRSTNLDGTGDFGKGLLAEKVQKAISIPLDQILGSLRSVNPLERQNAQALLDERARSARELELSDKAKFADRIDQENFKDLALKEAMEKIKNIDLNGKGLDNAGKINEFLSITGELGNENLTPALRRARLQALGSAAGNARDEAVKAAAQARVINETMSEVNRQLKAGGLRTTLSETPIVEIEVRDGSLSATQRSLGTRANSSNVQELTQ